MIKTLLLIFAPDATWERIAQARRSLGFVLVGYLLPLLVLSSAGEAYGLINWGKWQAMVPTLKRFSPWEAAGYEVAQLLLALAILFVSALVVLLLGHNFHGRHTFRQAFTLIAYGLSPVFLLRLLNAFPAVSPWVTWSIGITLSLAILYHGVPRVMDPDPPQTFGIYLTAALLVLVTSGVARLVTAWYLQGRFTRLEPLLSTLGGRPHF